MVGSILRQVIRTVVRVPVIAVVWPIGTLAERWLLWTRPKVRITDGLSVHDWAFDRSRSAERLSKVKAALDVLARYDERRALWLMNSGMRLIIMKTPSAHYERSLRACALPLTEVDTAPPHGLALIIIHEATHHRIEQAGIRYRLDLRDRIEARCVSEELAFAERLPNATEIAAWVRARSGEKWYSADQLRAFRDRRLQEAGAPVWLRRVVAALQ